MKKLNFKNRNYIIIGLCAVLVLMAVGFAAFSQNLQINGTSNISSSWDIRITGIRAVNLSSVTNNGAYDITEPSIGSDNLSASFQTGLKSPGDTRIYEIEVTNRGSLDAEVSTVFTNTLSDSVHFSYDGVGPLGGSGTDVLTNAGVYNTANVSSSEPFSLPATTNNIRYIYMTVKYRDSVTSQPSNLTASINLKLNATQSPSGAETIDSGIHTLSTNGKDIPIVTEGDGLYDNNDGQYIYKGSNPDNYLEFEGNIWRILKFDTTGIKIISDEAIDLTGYTGVKPEDNTKGMFDIPNERTTANNSYCINPSRGCNAWVATSKMNGSPSEFVNKNLSGVEIKGTVTEDSSLYIYLNGYYYNNVLKENSLIIDGIFNIGPEANESQYTWTGKIALLTKEEFKYSHPENRLGLTYLSKNYNWWNINPDLNYTTNGVRAISYDNSSYGQYVNKYLGVRPVFYLSSNVTLTGNGTNDENIYRIAS